MFAPFFYIMQNYNQAINNIKRIFESNFTQDGKFSPDFDVDLELAANDLEQSITNFSKIVNSKRQEK